MPPLTPEEQVIHNPIAAIASRMPGYGDIAEALSSPESVPGLMRSAALGAGQIPGIGGTMGAGLREYAELVSRAQATPPALPPAPSHAVPEGMDPGLRAALMGGGGGKGGGGGAGTSTTRLGRPQDRPYLEGERAAGEQLAAQQARLAEQQTRVSALHDQTLRDWAQEAKDAHARFGEIGVEMAREYRSTAGEIKAARDQLKTMKVDSTRLWDSMPTTQKVLMAIGSMAGGFAEGISGGKIANDVGRWWEQAVARDIEQQRDAIKAKMNEVDLGQKERDDIWKKWQQSEEQIRTAAGRASQLEISRLALATDDVKMKGELAKSIADIGARVRSAEHTEFVAAQPTITKSYSSGGASGASGGGASPETIARAMAYDKAVKAGREILAIQERHKEGVPAFGADLERWRRARAELLLYRARGRGLAPKAIGQELKIEKEQWHEPSLIQRVLGTETEKVKAHKTVSMARDTEEEARVFWAAMARGKIKPKKGK